MALVILTSNFYKRLATGSCLIRHAAPGVALTFIAISAFVSLNVLLLNTDSRLQ